MQFNSKSISDIIEKESDFFQELLNEYQFYIKVGNLPKSALNEWIDSSLNK